MVCLYLWDMSIVNIIWNNPTGLLIYLPGCVTISGKTIFFVQWMVSFETDVLIKMSTNRFCPPISRLFGCSVIGPWRCNLNDNWDKNWSLTPVFQKLTHTQIVEVQSELPLSVSAVFDIQYNCASGEGAWHLGGFGGIYYTPSPQEIFYFRTSETPFAALWEQLQSKINLMKWATIIATLTTRCLGRTKREVLAEIWSLWKMFHFIKFRIASVMFINN